MQIDLFVFDRFPQPLDEYVVAPAAPPVPAELDLIGLQRANEIRAGELATLVGVHEFRGAVVVDRGFQGVHAGIRAQVVRLSAKPEPCGSPSPAPPSGRQSRAPSGCRSNPWPTPDWVAQCAGRAADTDRSGARDSGDWCWPCGTAPRYRACAVSYT